MDDMVSIPRSEYEKLVADQRWLSALENAGVDNWDGIDYAQELFNEE